MIRLQHAVTFLFAPGNRPERFDKAMASGADVVIIDLEDSVEPAGKPAARDAVSAFLAREPRVVVRINAIGTPWFSDDLAMLAGRSPCGVMLPKAESREQLSEVAARLDGIAQIPLVETATGIAALAELAAVSGASRFAFGTIDFQLDLGIEGDGEELQAFRSEIVLRSRLAGLAPPVDGLTASVVDDALLRSDSERARRFGFGGKLCIHPRQVGVVATAFAPRAEDIARAQQIIAAAEASTTGVVAVDGRMVDKPVLDLARRTLMRATNLQASEGRHGT